MPKRKRYNLSVDSIHDSKIGIKYHLDDKLVDLLNNLDRRINWFKTLVNSTYGLPANKDKQIAELKQKLVKFEDFMEEQGFNTLEELDNYIQTIHSHYDEIKNKGTCGFCEHLDNKENQALKDKWQKLKEWLTTYENFLEQVKHKKYKKN